MLRVDAFLLFFFCSLLIWPDCHCSGADCRQQQDENGRGEERCESSSQGNDSKGRKEKMVFGGSVERSSDPLPEDATREQVSRFLRDEKRANLGLIASAGGARETREVPRTEELDGLWKECCLDTYGAENLPAPDDPIFVTNTTSRFPGLRLTTTVYNGIKTFESEAGIPPRFVLNMIAETQAPTGFPPFVWAFHKLMGFCEPEGSLRPCGRVQSVLSVVEDDSDGDDRRRRRMAFRMDVSVRIEVEFPAVLVRILPMRKDKAEAVASSSIMKSVSRDVKTAVAGMQKAFAEWHSASVEGGVDGARRIPDEL